MIEACNFKTDKTASKTSNEEEHKQYENEEVEVFERVILLLY